MESHSAPENPEVHVQFDEDQYDREMKEDTLSVSAEDQVIADESKARLLGLQNFQENQKQRQRRILFSTIGIVFILLIVILGTLKEWIMFSIVLGIYIIFLAITWIIYSNSKRADITMEDVKERVIETKRTISRSISQENINPKVSDNGDNTVIGGSDDTVEVR